MLSLFIGIVRLFFNYTIFTGEFDKMQIPLSVKIVLHSFSRKVSLATIGVCVFVRLTSVAALFIIAQRIIFLGGKQNEKNRSIVFSVVECS